MDQVELISIAVAGGLVLVIVLVVILRKPMGGSRSGDVDPLGNDGGAMGGD